MYISPVLLPADVMWPAAWVSVLTSTTWWTLVWNCKPNKPFHPQVAFCWVILSRHQKGSYDGDREGDWRQIRKVSCAGVMKGAIDSTTWFSTFTCTHVTPGHQNMRDTFPHCLPGDVVRSHSLWLSPTRLPSTLSIPSLTLWPMLPSTSYCQYKYTALTLQRIKDDLFWC